MAIVRLHDDDFADGACHQRFSFLEIYERFGKPSALVDANAKFEVTRTMAMLQVLFFIFCAAVSCALSNHEPLIAFSFAVHGCTRAFWYE